MNTHHTAKTKLLVVDDDKTILTAFSCLMHSLAHEYEVEFFSSPQLALETLIARPTEFHLVMTDIRMPGMDGLTFAQAVRKIVPNVPIIFMTAYASNDFSKKVTQFKRAAYFEKPFHLETILKETIPALLHS